MEDVVMTEGTKEEVQAPKDSSLYQDYRKIMINLEKAITLKDSKTLLLYSRLLNKFRKGFTDEDCQFLCDTFLRERSTVTFKVVPELNSSLKVHLIF